MIATQDTNGAIPARMTSEPASPITDLADWRLNLLIRDFARFVNSEVALLYQLGSDRQPPTVICSWGLGAAPRADRATS
jgi:hypothetical protein